MELIRPGTNIDFMSKKFLALGISLILILIGIASLIIHNGPRYGIDFSGGLLVQVRFDKATSSSEISEAVTKQGLVKPTVQHSWEFGGTGGKKGEYIVRLDLGEGAPEELTQSVRQALEDHYGAESIEIRRVDMVGPKVGKDLRSKGLKSMIFALIGILIYISWRFELKFACGAVVALIHDVLITVGVFSVLDKEVSLPIIAALLAVIGYSLNDTIVVYDRIRENFRKNRRAPFPITINKSINETLSRTLLTSGTTLLVVIALFLFGGGVIHDFAFALLVGIIVGTYSSIFVASPVVIFWQDIFKPKGTDALKRKG